MKIMYCHDCNDEKEIIENEYTYDKCKECGSYLLGDIITNKPNIVSKRLSAIIDEMNELLFEIEDWDDVLEQDLNNISGRLDDILNDVEEGEYQDLMN